MAQTGFSLLDRSQQWEECTLDGTTIDADGHVSLAWTPALPDIGAEPAPSEAAGLAFDRWCRVVRSEPDIGRVTWSPVDEALTDADRDCSGQGTLRRPLGLDIDRGPQVLYVADATAGMVYVIDLTANRTLRRISVRTPQHRQRRPVDIAVGPSDVWVLVRRTDGLVRLRGRRGPLAGPELIRPLKSGSWTARRIEASGDDVLVLWHGQRGASLVATADGEGVVDQSELTTATDLALAEAGRVLVVAGLPGEPFARFDLDRGGQAIEPLDAPGYDGSGIAVSPAGEVAFRSRHGLRWALASAARYRSSGRLITYRIDSERYRNRWGRLFLDACAPPGTSLQVGFMTTDVDDVDDPIDGVDEPVLPPRAPAHLVAALGQPRPVFRRAAPELAYRPDRADSAAMTYEAPIDADPGRYLWVVVNLSGGQRVTPRIEALRVERSGHPLVGMLPSAWSRRDADADFLHRLLAPIAGLVTHYDILGELRHLLLHPHVVPADALDWLARFVGLVLDDRWPDRARRTALAEASQLFARRGTLAVTERFLEIYLGFRAPVVEHWRVRGLGGGLLGAEPGSEAAPILGQGTRMGGTLGHLVLGSREGDRSAFATHAHRFAVLVPTELNDEQRAVVERILDLHRPAHTVYQLCELAYGGRVGQRFHLGLTSVPSAPTEWEPLLLGLRGRGHPAGTLGGAAVTSAGSRLGFGPVGQTRVA